MDWCCNAERGKIERRLSGVTLSIYCPHSQHKHKRHCPSSDNCFLVYSQHILHVVWLSPKIIHFCEYIIKARARVELVHWTDQDTKGQKEQMREDEGLRKFLRTKDCGVLERVEKIMVLDWGWSEMVVNSCPEDVVGRLKIMWKLVLKVGEKRHKWVVVSSDPGMWVI